MLKWCLLPASFVLTTVRIVRVYLKFKMFIVYLRYHLLFQKGELKEHPHSLSRCSPSRLLSNRSTTATTAVDRSTTAPATVDRSTTAPATVDRSTTAPAANSSSNTHKPHSQLVLARRLIGPPSHPRPAACQLPLATRVLTPAACHTPPVRQRLGRFQTSCCVPPRTAPAVLQILLMLREILREPLVTRSRRCDVPLEHRLAAIASVHPLRHGEARTIMSTGIGSYRLTLSTITSCSDRYATSLFGPSLIFKIGCITGFSVHCSLSWDIFIIFYAFTWSFGNLAENLPYIKTELWESDRTWLKC